MEKTPWFYGRTKPELPGVYQMITACRILFGVVCWVASVTAGCALLLGPDWAAGPFASIAITSAWTCYLLGQITKD